MSAALRTTAGAILSVIALAIIASVPVSFGLDRSTTLGAGVLTLFAVLCFGIVPLLLVKYVLREEIRAFGWRLPTNTRDVLLFGIPAGLVLIGGALFLSTQPAFKAFYSFGSIDTASAFLFLLPAYLLYFTAEEFLFRGYLWHLLRRKGLFLALAVNVALFALFHAQKPAVEVLVAAVVAVVFCLLTERTRSILPAVVLHIVFALSLMLFVNL